MAKKIEAPSYMTTAWVRQKTANEGRSLGLACLAAAAIQGVMAYVAKTDVSVGFLMGGAVIAFLFSFAFLAFYIRGQGALRHMLQHEAGQELLERSMQISNRQRELDRTRYAFETLSHNLAAVGCCPKSKEDLAGVLQRRQCSLNEEGDTLLRAQLSAVDAICRERGYEWPFTCERPSEADAASASA